MMKKRPGTTIRPEKRKNQRRFPMMSSTSARLTAATGDQRSGLELLLAESVEARRAGPVVADDPAQDRPRHGDRGEHRAEHTDDQDQREAPDRRRPEDVQDRGGDERGHVRVEDGVPGAVEASLHRRAERLPGTELLLHPLEDQDIGVDRHTCLLYTSP